MDHQILHRYKKVSKKYSDKLKPNNCTITKQFLLTGSRWLFAFWVGRPAAELPDRYTHFPKFLINSFYSYQLHKKNEK